MRSDIHKVIVERPRYGYAWAEPVKTGGKVSVRSAVEQGDDFDSGPRRAPWFDKDKSFNEYLAPLRGYLENQVGRPWDKVYSEICQGIDRRSVIGAHVLQHVPDFVELPGDRWPGRATLRVDARTGLVVRRKQAPRRDKPRPVVANFFPTTPGRAFTKIKEFWFEVTYHEQDPDPRIFARGIRRIVFDSKRQCNKKEIARIEAGTWKGFHLGWYHATGRKRAA